MNTPVGFKQRLGAELALLEEAQAADETSGQNVPVTAGRFFARPGVRRTAWVGLAAGTVAAAVVVATSGGQGVRNRSVDAMTVAQVLDAAATHAAKGPDREPGLHQWVYTDTVVCYDDCGHQPHWMRYDGAKAASVGKTFRTGDRTVVSVSDIAASMGSGVGHKPQETREVLSRLPTDPRKLLERVSDDPFFAGGVDPSAVLPYSPDKSFNSAGETSPAVTPGARFARIVNVLEVASNIPPRINAALYRALALIPGTELVAKPMKDAAGRPGTAITFDFHDRARTRAYLFLDPDTYAYRGSRTDWRGEGNFSDAFAHMKTGIVDHPGQVPGGPAPDPSDVVEEEPTLIVPLKPR
ncbi:CU044_5270 family protein [Streptomyces sp. NBC_01104]|uniref:CU044_5270 family protein n=1 Tax=Streptomyces sp. NBC_01104 TaxID=2903750 RepID=UPI0038637F69|nr:CU044_5270 family protein [Streptomyces sp. NBC_01104]